MSPVGISNFEGSRLREAREARGLTAVNLAEIIGKTPAAVSKYEQNVASPQQAILEDIARALRMPVAFFTLPARTERNGTIFYRSMSAVTKRARTRADWKLEWLEDITGYLSRFVEFPKPNIPNFGLPEDPLKISEDDIESIAIGARRYWGMDDSPIANIVTLLENQGVIIAQHQLEANTLDSLSTFSKRDGRPYIIIGNDKGCAVRWRFDVAHELGHLLLHPYLDKRELTTSALFKQIENQAHHFARAFLLPVEPFGNDFFAFDLEPLRAVKLKWKVSIAAMIYRGRDILPNFTEYAERRLWINLSRRGWKQKEPYDDVIPAEEPKLLKRAIEMVLESGEQTTDDLTANLNLEESDIEGLVGLPNGFLRCDFAPVQLIKRSSISASDMNRPQATIIPIRKKENDQNI
jgi:Zn-dependent peptidase ImmA (M78 family)/DNA-binding XRE family transcriptional regulator